MNSHAHPRHAPGSGSTLRKRAVMRGWPIRRILSRGPRPPGRSFIWAGCHHPARAANPDRGAETPCRRGGAQSLFGLASGGACRAPPVARGAVGSYPTVSPLPRANPGRSVLCGAFPRVSPAGRYPAPLLREVRTFLTAPKGSATAWPSARAPPTLGRKAGQSGSEAPCPSLSGKRLAACTGAGHSEKAPDTRPGRRSAWRDRPPDGTARARLLQSGPDQNGSSPR